MLPLGNGLPLGALRDSLGRRGRRSPLRCGIERSSCSTRLMSGGLAAKFRIVLGRFFECDALGFGEGHAFGLEVSRQRGSSLSVRGDPGNLDQFGCAAGSASALRRALGDSAFWSH